MLSYRAELLCCAGEQDFLAKVHCVRLAFDSLVQSSTHRNYFMEVGRNLMSAFLQDTNQDPSLFVDRFNGLVHYMEEGRNWEVAKKELTARHVRMGRWVGGCSPSDVKWKYF